VITTSPLSPGAAGRPSCRTSTITAASSGTLPGDHIALEAIIEIEHRDAEALFDLPAHMWRKVFRIGGDEARTDLRAIVIRQFAGQRGERRWISANHMRFPFPKVGHDPLPWPHGMRSFAAKQSESLQDPRPVCPPHGEEETAPVCHSQPQAHHDLHAKHLEKTALKASAAHHHRYTSRAAGGIVDDPAGIHSAGDDVGLWQISEVDFLGRWDALQIFQRPDVLRGQSSAIEKAAIVRNACIRMSDQRTQPACLKIPEGLPRGGARQQSPQASQLCIQRRASSTSQERRSADLFPSGAA